MKPLSHQTTIYFFISVIFISTSFYISSCSCQGKQSIEKKDEGIIEWDYPNQGKYCIKKIATRDGSLVEYEKVDMLSCEQNRVSDGGTTKEDRTNNDLNKKCTVSQDCSKDYICDASTKRCVIDSEEAEIRKIRAAPCEKIQSLWKNLVNSPQYCKSDKDCIFVRKQLPR